MPDDIAIDLRNADAAEILRDLDEAKRMTGPRASYKVLLLKGALEHLMTLERSGSCLSPRVIEHLRASVLRELTTL